MRFKWQEYTNPFAFVKSLYRKINCHLCNTTTTDGFYDLPVSKEYRKYTANKDLGET